MELVHSDGVMWIDFTIHTTSHVPSLRSQTWLYREIKIETTARYSCMVASLPGLTCTVLKILVYQARQAKLHLLFSSFSLLELNLSQGWVVMEHLSL